MRGPFVVRFALAGFGLELIEGNKIRTSEYLSIGVMYLFIMGSIAIIFILFHFCR